MDSTKEYPGMTNESHPECFNIEAMPAQPKEKKRGQLPDHLIKQFFEEVCQQTRTPKLLRRLMYFFDKTDIFGCTCR